MPPKQQMKLGQFDEDMLGIIDFDDLSALTRYNWTIDKVNALLFVMRRRKLAGLNKHLSMILIEENLREILNEHIPLPAIWEFICHFWDMKAADELEAKVHLPFENIDFSLPQTEEWQQLIKEEEEKYTTKMNDTKKDQASTSNMCLNDADQATISNKCSDETIQAKYSNLRLSATLQGKITDEDLKRMISVKVKLERINILTNDGLETNKANNNNKTKNELDLANKSEVSSSNALSSDKDLKTNIKRDESKAVIKKKSTKKNPPRRSSRLKTKFV